MTTAQASNWGHLPSQLVRSHQTRGMSDVSGALAYEPRRRHLPFLRAVCRERSGEWSVIQQREELAVITTLTSPFAEVFGMAARLDTLRRGLDFRLQRH